MGVLITEKLITIIAKCTQQGEIVKAHPFHWNEAQRELERNDSGNAYFIWKCNMVTLASYYLYINARFAYLISQDGFHLKNYVLSILLLAYYNFIPMTLVPVIKGRHYLPTIYGRIVKAFRMFEELYCKEVKSPPLSIRASEIICNLFLKEFPFNGFMFGAGGVLYRRSVISIYPALQFLAILACGDDYGQMVETLLLILTAVFHSYTMFNIIPLCSLFTIMFYEVVVLGNASLSIMRSKPPAYQPDDVSKEIKMYRIMEMVLGDASSIFSFSLGLTQTITIVLGIMGAYCVIRIGGFVALVAPCGLICTGVLLTVLSITADLHLKSHELLLYWKSMAHVRSREHGRSCRALKPFSVEIGSLYYVDKLLVLTVVKIVVDNIVNILLV